jgi:hypothetical protein
MKTKILLMIFIMSFLLTSGFSQVKTKKELKAEKKLEQQKQIEALINAKEFVFEGRTAFPSGMRSVDLTTKANFVKYHPDLIESQMPYYGRAYSVAYGGDSGLKFSGKPEEYKVEKKKKQFEISAIVVGESDRFTLNLTVYFEGTASLSIISNNRSSISYQGEISAPKMGEDKK